MTFYFIWLCSSRKCCYIPVLHWLFADRHILNLAELLFICPVMLLHYFEVKLTTPCIVLTLYWPFIFFSLVNCRYFRGAFFWRGASWGLGLGVVLFLFVLFFGVVSVSIFFTRDEKHLNYKWNHRQCAYFCLVVIALTQYFLFLFPFL